MGGVRKLLGENRLVTLTGPGGTGKTRLAIETARSAAGNYPDGVFFVGLATLADAALVATTIADALSVREEGTRPVVETLKEYFSRKRMLLLLDNFEQIVSAAPLVSELLTAAPDITVLVTSRAPLRIAGEQEYPVPSMTLPDPERLPDPEGLSAYDSVELFVQRARAVRPDFELTADNGSAVARICVKLDGLPLAIELAAARIRLLSPQDILTRLDRSLSLLSRGARDAPHRQQTLMNAIEWSYRLLDEDRQALFRRLGVFVGGWTLEAATAICDPDGKLTVDMLDRLESLVTNSLVQVRHKDGGDTRFVMLRTIREFALEALSEGGELAELSHRHAAHFAVMAQTAEAKMFDENEDWPDRLGLEHDNLRAALRHLIDARDPRNGLAMASSLWRFWQIRSHLAEGRQWLADFLALPESDTEPALRAKALNAIGGLTYWQNDFEVTRTYYEEALELYRSLGDRRGIGESLYNNGFLLLINREPQRARALYKESMSVYRELDDELGVAFAKWGLAMSFFQERDTHAARRFGLESHETFARLENWFGRSLSDYVLVQVDRIAGNYEGARQKLMVQLLEEPELLKDISSFSSYLEVLADLEIATGHVRRGLKLASGAFKLRTEYGGGAPPPLLDLEDPKELARVALSPAEIEAAWEEGARFSLDEILTYARKDPDADE
ncbi:MAG: ATP-binding protein [Actinomycetota bacterium]